MSLVSPLAFGLGGDIAVQPPGQPDGHFRKIAQDPSYGIRFAIAGAEMRNIFPTEVGQVNNVSAPVCTAGSMDPCDKDNMSGVIRKRGRKGNSSLPRSIKR